LKRFEEPDDVRTFEKGKFEIVRIGGTTIGRATYLSGWKWSVHVGPAVGASRCNVEHVGLVLSGCITVAMDDGTIHELRAGMLFYIPPGPPGHDSWVVGYAPYVSLHFLGTEHYTQVAEDENRETMTCPHFRSLEYTTESFCSLTCLRRGWECEGRGRHWRPLLPLQRC